MTHHSSQVHNFSYVWHYRVEISHIFIDVSVNIKLLCVHYTVLFSETPATSKRLNCEVYIKCFSQHDWNREKRYWFIVTFWYTNVNVRFEWNVSCLKDILWMIERWLGRQNKYMWNNKSKNKTKQIILYFLHDCKIIVCDILVKTEFLWT